MQDGASNVDLLLYLGEKSYDELTLAMRSGYVGQSTEWDVITPDRAVAALAKMKSLNTEPVPSYISGCDYHSGLSYVRAFRTQDGLVGIYQLRGVDDISGHGVQVRYRLVQPRYTANDNAPATKPGEFSAALSPPHLSTTEAVPAENSGKVSQLPPRQMFRLHSKDRVAALAYSPDGRILAIGGDPQTVSLYDAKTGKPITTLKLFSTDEEAILAAAKGKHGDVQWRALVGLEVRAGVSPDSSLLAVGTDIGQVKLFNARTGAFMLSLDDVDRKAGKRNLSPNSWSCALRRGMSGQLRSRPTANCWLPAATRSTTKWTV